MRNERLRTLRRQMTEVMAKDPEGRARLCLAAQRRERMIERYISGSSVPPSDVAYRLAVACGWTDKEAGALSTELASSAMESA
jgi:hypothetical protein